MALFTDFPFGSVLVLEEQVTTAAGQTATFSWDPDSEGPYATTASGKTLVTAGVLKLSPRDAATGGSEKIYATNGTLNADGDKITFSLSVRGIPDSENAYPPTESNSTLIKAHKARKIALFSPDILINQLENTFSASSNVQTILNNYGSFAAGKAASIRSSARPEQGNDAVIGIYTNTGVDGETATIQTINIYSPVTVAGGVIGGNVYADSNGDLTATATNNVFVGKLIDTQKIKIGERAEQDLEYDNSLIIDQNTMALMNDKNIKNFGLNGSETWTGAQYSADTVNIKVLGSIGVRHSLNTGDTDVLHSLPSALALTVTDGGDSLDTTQYIGLAVYVDDATNIIKSQLILDSGTAITNAYIAAMALSTGWNYVKIKKSAFSTVGSPDWGNINSIRTRGRTSVGTAYITHDPTTIQVIRKDPTTPTIPNPFQEEISTGVFERVLAISAGDVGIYKVLGNYASIEVGDGTTAVLDTNKEWANFSAEASFSKNVESSIDVADIGSEQGRRFGLYEPTTLSADKDSQVDNEEIAVSASDSVAIAMAVKGTKIEGIFNSELQSNLALHIFSAGSNASGAVLVRVGEGNALDFMKVTNTSAIIENKPIYKFENPRVIHRETITSVGSDVHTLDFAGIEVTQADMLLGRYQISVMQDQSATETLLYGGYGAANTGYENHNWLATDPAGVVDVHWQAGEVKIFIVPAGDYSIIIHKLW